SRAARSARQRSRNWRGVSEPLAKSAVAARYGLVASFSVASGASMIRPPQGRLAPLFFVRALVVIVNVVQKAAALRPERPVIGARRPASVCRCVERLAALALRVVAHDEVAGNEIDLFPMVMHERGGGIDAGIEAQEPRAASHLAALVEVAREDF